MPIVVAPIPATVNDIGIATGAVGGNQEAAINTPEATGFTKSSQNPGP